MTSRTGALLATVALGALISVGNDLALAKGGGGHGGGGGGGHGPAGAHITAGGHRGHASPGAHFAGSYGFSGAHLRAAHQSANSFNRGVSSSRHFAHGAPLAHTSNITHGNLAHSSNVANRLTHDPLHDPNWNHWGTTYSRAGWSTGWNNWLEWRLL